MINILRLLAHKNNSFMKVRSGEKIIHWYCTTASAEVNDSHINRLLEKHKEVLYYCDYAENRKLKLGYNRNKAKIDIITKEVKAENLRKLSEEPIPITLRYFDKELFDENTNRKTEEKNNTPPETPIQFPFQETKNEKIHEETIVEPSHNIGHANESDLEVRMRFELYNKSKEHLNWMNDFENYEISENPDLSKDTLVNYGTPDPKSKISKIPCGGCGALLHCKDSAIPGYIPSELFKNSFRPGGTHLKTLTCQRCHFLKNYDLALQVRVDADDYPKVLETINHRSRALVILMVDLLDFPCSIWPGIADLIGSKRPIIVVGNKVDLLPQDGKGYLERVEKHLVNSVREHGFGRFNIRDVVLVSAKTGYGVENLVTKLHNIWNYKGDVFLVGCTNVGKSSLFNALLQSDYCKSQASDLIQRATTSPWPGTTLNLLKFPILRPTGWRQYIRFKRIISSRKLEFEERSLRKDQLRLTKNTKYATLIGHIGRTFPNESNAVEDQTDLFNTGGKRVLEMGELNENASEYKLNKWCYDTPGVIQPDQIIHLLTTEELVLTFPKNIIKPRTFSLYPGSSLFIGGLARLDYLEGNQSCRFTVFSSRLLPITICKTNKADELYEEFLTTDAFSVPINHPDRLKVWPGLDHSKNFTVTGIDSNQSCSDIVLSSAGWVAITPNWGATCTIQGWTPEKRGIYLRDSLLDRAVSLRGEKIRRSCAYRSDRLYLK